MSGAGSLVASSVKATNLGSSNPGESQTVAGGIARPRARQLEPAPCSLSYEHGPTRRDLMVVVSVPFGPFVVFTVSDVSP